MPQDYLQARDWFQKAADLGFAPAQYNLAIMYRDGQGIAQDYTQAHDWFQKAAVQNHLYSQFNLGVMYFEGMGVPQDYEEAYFWYYLSSDLGYPKPAELERLHPAVIARVEKRAEEWRAQMNR